MSTHRTLPPGPRTDWVPERLRRTLRRVRSLQARLVIASVGLMTLVSIVIGAGAALALDRYLTQQLDHQAFDVAHFLAGPPPGRGNDDRPPPPNAGGGFGGGPDRPLNTLAVTVDDGRVVSAFLTERHQSAVPLPVSEVAAAVAVTPGDGPATITVAGEDYRAVAEPRDDGSTVVVGLNTGQIEGTVEHLVVAERRTDLTLAVVGTELPLSWESHPKYLSTVLHAAVARALPEVPLAWTWSDQGAWLAVPRTDLRALNAELGRAGEWTRVADEEPMAAGEVLRRGV